MEISFKNKVAFITGGSQGIGAAISKTIAQCGASVGIIDKNEEALTKMIREINDLGGKAFGTVGDVSNPEDMERAVSATVQQFGGLHLAVNNAGIGSDFGLLHESSIENWKKVLGVNLNGIFYGMKYEITEMLKSGGGSIVNIASVEATILPLSAAYTTSKHGIAGLTKTAAYDYAKKGIRINTVSPGVIETPLIATQPEISTAMGKVVPMGRIGEPQEIANAVAFVLSDKASYMTGTELVIDGAFLLRQG